MHPGQLMDVQLGLLTKERLPEVRGLTWWEGGFLWDFQTLRKAMNIRQSANCRIANDLEEPCQDNRILNEGHLRQKHSQTGRD
ncbi:MAG: hypothetical protein CVU61_14820 [Deltaproteobacteria bacterium HGW-Deltaproteobacteria-19]|nr:MAG: hypothetical protein CVU61_14820 [Deltaproteobacteria bacterium HGW-Deltaproteobacteria-19]